MQHGPHSPDPVEPVEPFANKQSRSKDRVRTAEEYSTGTEVLSDKLLPEQGFAGIVPAFLFRFARL